MGVGVTLCSTTGQESLSRVFEVGDRVRLKPRTDEFSEWSGIEGIVYYVVSATSGLRRSIQLRHEPPVLANRASSSWYPESLELVSTEYEESVAILGEEYFA